MAAALRRSSRKRGRPLQLSACWRNYSDVAQVSNLLYRRLPVGRPFDRRVGCGLDIRDITGSKPRNETVQNTSPNLCHKALSLPRPEFPNDRRRRRQASLTTLVASPSISLSHLTHSNYFFDLDSICPCAPRRIGRKRKDKYVRRTDGIEFRKRGERHPAPTPVEPVAVVVSTHAPGGGPRDGLAGGPAAAPRADLAAWHVPAGRRDWPRRSSRALARGNPGRPRRRLDLRGWPCPYRY